MGFNPLSWSYWFYDKVMYVRFPNGIVLKKHRTKPEVFKDVSLNPLADRIHANFMKG